MFPDGNELLPNCPACLQDAPTASLESWFSDPAVSRALGLLDTAQRLHVDKLALTLGSSWETAVRMVTGKALLFFSSFLCPLLLSPLLFFPVGFWWKEEGLFSFSSLGTGK